MCDCFHLAFPNWQAASGTGAGRRLRAAEPGPEDDSTCDDPSQFTERPRPQGSSPVEDYPEEWESEHEPQHQSGSGKKSKRSGLGSVFEKRSTPKMSKLKEVHSPESGLMVKTARDGCAEGLVYGGGGREGIFIKEVVPESPASKSLKLKEGDQILSATVYFDNMSYEDAVQILEHAQAYKVKLCLKRKPSAADAEPAFESDIIPEEDVYAPEMREQGKSKRRGEARISWPKFPSFGKGHKSRFARSHSSSEADEQRKLELSPTTSDTESPIKSQVALKGKKKHKMKLPGLTKRGRISSSEDPDTDAPTSTQLLSPECLESSSEETPQVYVAEDLKVMEDLRRDPEPTEPQRVQHKVELISIAGTLKTEDLTVALAGQEGSSGIKSPDGKKKKELSELKIKMLGKDKSHKKAKSSPKRLKTLGASIETADSQTKLQGDLLALDAMSIPKGELEVSDVALTQKSPQKGEEKTKKGKGTKQKPDPTFKLPKVGFSDIASEETILKTYLNVEECATKVKQLTTEGAAVKEDPYERLSKSGLSRTKLPKREDIEIPGMEDMSKRTTGKRIKEPQTVFTGHHEDIQAETVQLLIDVDSVKEAISKLPGFKLPQVDTSGMPIPEEITMIDANAQRISVKTPTKTKHLSKLDVTEVSKTSIKLPKITPVDLASEELLVATQVDVKKTLEEYKAEPKQSHTEVYKREHILIPGRESAQEVALLPTQETQGIKSEYVSAATFKTKRTKITMPSCEITKPDIKILGIGIHSPKQNISEENVDCIKGERTIFLQEVEISKTETTNKIGGVVSDVQIPEIDGIEYIDSAVGSPVKKDGGTRLTGFGVPLNADSPKADVSFPDVGGKLKDFEAEKQSFKLPEFGAVTPNISVNVPDANEDLSIDVKTLEMEDRGGKFKIPNLSISMSKVKGPQMDFSLSKEDVDFPLSHTKAEVKLHNVEHTELGIKVEGKAPEIEVYKQDVQGSPSKLKMPTFKLPTVGVGTPNVSVEVCDMEKDGKIDCANINRLAFNIEAPSVDIEGPSVDVKATGTDHEGKEGQFKMPHLGFSMPKVKGTRLNLSSSKKDVEVTLPKTSAKIKLPKAPKIDASLGEAEVFISESKVEVKKPDLEMKPLQSNVEIDGQGSKFKIPTLGMSMQKVKEPEIHFGLSKKDGHVTLPEAKAAVKVPEVVLKELSAKVEINAPEIKVEAKVNEASASRFKMPTFKLPKFGVGTPNVSVELPDMDKDVKIDGADIKFPDEGSTVDILAPSIYIDGPSMDMKTTAAEQNGKGSKYKMPNLGFSMKGPKIEDIDVKLPETTVDVKLPDVDLGKVDVSLPEAKVEFKKPEMDLQFVQSEDELHGQGEQFKKTKFGISMPNVKGPEFDFSSSKKDVDISLLHAKVNLPNVELKESSAEVEMKAPKIEAPISSMKESPSTFKLPTFKFPTFGATTPNVSTEVPDIDKEIKIDGADMHISVPHTVVDEAEIKAEVHVKRASVGVEVDAKLTKPKFSLPRFSFSNPSVKAPELDTSLQDATVAIPEGKVEVRRGEVELPECEAEVEASKFKMPKFGISTPKVTGPESLSKKDVDVTLSEAKAEIKLPNVKVREPEEEIKASEIKIGTKGTKGSPSKYKMPTFKFPKFGVGNQSATIAMPDKDVNIDGADITIPKEVLRVDIAAPSIDIEGPSIEHEGKGSKFKLPSLGFSGPQIKGPDIDLSLSKKDVDVTLPEAKAGVQLPDVKLKDTSTEMEIKGPGIDVQTTNVEGSSAKYKMPTFTFPKFGSATPKVSVEVPDVDKDIKVDVTAPSIDTEGLSVDMKAKGSELDVSGRKLKMPKFGISMPKVKGPEIDLRFSEKDVDVTLPEANAEVKLPSVEVKQPSVTVDIKAPEIEAETDNVEGSSSKFKMPTFKLPKFGVGSRTATIEVPHMDKDVNIDGADIKFPENVISVDIAAPSIDIEGPSIDREGKGSTFELPSLGLSGPQIKGPDIDLSLSKKYVDVTLPEANAGVQLPDVKLKDTSAEVEIKAPQIKIGTKGSPSKYKMPTFKFPKFGVGTQSATIAMPDKDVNIDGADITISKEVLRVDIAAPSIDIEGPSIEHEGKGSKFKLPSLGLSGPQIKGPDVDLSLSKKDVDVTLPEANAGVQLPDVKLKDTSTEMQIKGPGIDVQTTNVEGSSAKYKMPTFTFPKFGSATPKVSVEVPDVDKDIKVDVTAPSIDTEGLSVDMKAKGSELDVSGSKFKMPKFGISMPKVKGPEIDLRFSEKDVDVTLPEANAEVKLPSVEVKQPSATVDIKAPEIEAETDNVEGSSSKFKMPTFKFPTFGVGSRTATIEVPHMNKDVNIDGADIKIPENVISVDIAAPSIDIEGPSIDREGKGSKFKLPSLGLSGPQIKGPDIDLSLSKKDVDVTLPEAKAGVQLPDVKLKDTSTAMEIKGPEIKIGIKGTKGSPSKYKMPTFTFPKFGSATPKVSVEVPDVDKDIKVDATAPSIDTEGLSVDMKAKGSELDVSGSKFKMPKFGISMPKVKGPEIDLRFSEKDVDVTLPEANAEVKLPSVEVKQPSATVDIKADVNLDAPNVDVTLPVAKTEIHLPGIDIKESCGISVEEGPVTDLDAKIKKPRFSLPKFSFSKQSSKESTFDASLPDIDVSLPEGNVEVKQPEVEVKPPEGNVDLEGQESKFKMPKFGISMPKVKGPEIDLSFLKKDIDVTLPEAKAEVQLSDVKIKQNTSATVEIKAPEIEAPTGNVEGSPSKFKMPTFTLPKFESASPKVSVEVPDVDKDIKVDVTAPSIDTEGLSVDMKAKGSELDVSGSKFKMPKFGISMPKVKGPEIDLRFSEKDVDVTLPEANAEVKLPSVEVKQPSATVDIKAPEIEAETDNVEGSSSKFKMPTFKFPTFGVGSRTATIEVPHMDKDVKIDGADIKIPENVISVDIAAPSIDIEGPSIDREGKGSKFKLPSLGFSGPQIKGPDIDLSLSKKDVDVTLPEANAGVQLPDVKLKDTSAEVEIKAPQIKIGTKGSPSKYKMPTFKFPKFGVGTQSATIAMPDKDVNIDGADITISKEVLRVDIAAPSIDIEGPSIEHEGKGSKFKLPSLGLSGPQIKGPDVDLSLSKKDVDVTLPEANAGVQLPDVKLKDTSTEMQIKGPGIDVQTTNVEGSSAKYKMPTFTFPKFGSATPKVSVEVPDVDKDIKVDVTAPSIDTEGLSVDMKAKGSELDVSGSKFKMPKFGISMPKVKGPEIDLRFSEKDVDVTLPEANAEVKLPSVEVKQPSVTVDIKAPEIEAETDNVEGSSSKFKMPTFKFPTFGVGSRTATIEVPHMNKDVNIDGADIKIPENVISVDIAAPSIDIEGPSIDREGKGSKFKLPSLGLSGPQIKGPDIDLSLSKKDVDVTLPEAKAGVQLPDVKLKDTSTAMEIKGPEIKIGIKGTKGSPSKYKMPTFTFPKFGSATPKVSVEVPDVDKDIKVDATAPSIDTEGLSVDMKAKGSELDVSGSKFKMPKFGISMPKVKGPEIDLRFSEKDVDVTLPEANAEVKLPSVEVKQPSATVDIKADVNLDAPNVDVTLPVAKTEIHLPGIDIKESCGISVEEGPVTDLDAKIKKPRFSLPKFSFSKQSSKESTFDASLPDIDVSLPEGNVEVKQPEVEVKPPEGNVDLEGQESKFKMPKFGISMPKVKGPEIDLSFLKKDIDVTLPEAKAEVQLSDVKIKQNTSATVEIKAPEIEAPTGNVEGSPSKFKMPTFTLPKFESASPKVSVEVPDVDKDIKVDVTAPSIDTEGLSVDMKAKGSELDVSGSKFKMPKFGISMPKVKGPEIDLRFSEKDVDVTLPEANAEVKLPSVEVKQPSATVDIKAPEIEAETDNVEGSSSKFKMPTFKFPTFGVGSRTATIEVPHMDKDVKIDGADIKIPENVISVDIAAPSIDIEGPSIDREGKGSKFKLPSLGFSGPQIKGPDIDLSLSKKDVDVTLPEANAGVQLPDVKLKDTSAEVEIKAPQIKIGTKASPSKYKMPTFKFPKFGVGTQSDTIEMPDKDVNIDGVDITISKEVLRVDIAAPSIDIEGPSIEHEGKGSKFKLPSLGLSGPQIKRTDIDLSLSKKDVDVTLPEAKAGVQLPDVKLKDTSTEMEIKGPEIKIGTKGTKGSPSKYKMPTFTFPKFGSATPKVSVEVPDVDKDIKVDATAPSIDTEGLSVDMKAKGSELDVSGSKFKMPKFGISMPKVKGPEIDLRFSEKDVDVTLPEANAEVKLPSVEVKQPSATVDIKADVNLDAPNVDVTLPVAKTEIHLPGIDIKESYGISVEEGPVTDLDAKIKKPRFSLPKFSFSKQSSKESTFDASLPDIDVSLPEGNVEVKQPEVEVKPPEGNVDLEGQESKFKMPKFGISMPKVKGPEIDLSFLKKDIDVTLPEAKAEVQLPDVKIKQNTSATVEIKAPEIEAPTGNVEGSPSKFKMPTFTLPKFESASPKVSVEVPDVDKDIKVDVTAPSIDTEGLSVDMKAKGSELDVSGSKFKMPKFGISMPKVKGPEIDLRFSEKDVDVTLPEANAEVKLPSVEVKQPSATVDIKAPEIEAETDNVEGSSSKFKMPTFKFPTFGVGSRTATIEVPHMDKDVNIDGADIKIPENVISVDIAAPSIDIEGPSIDREGKGSKFKLPSLGLSGPQIKGPDIDLSLSKKDVDVTLPEANAGVQLPDVKLKDTSAEVEIKAPQIKIGTKGSPSKYKMPTFKFPKFGVGTQSDTIEMPDKDVNIDGVDITISKEVLRVDIAAPSIDIEGPSIEHEGKGSKFKLPSLGLSGPQIKGPDVDLSLSKKDVDVTLPEANAGVQLPDVKLKDTSTEMEIKGPEIKIGTKGTKGSPSKYKMPTFTFPKFGSATPKVSVEVPDVDKDIKVDATAPSIDTEGLSVDMKAKGSELDVSGSKFKMPKFGISMPKVKGPEIDLRFSEKDVDVTLPEANAEVKLPSVEVKQPEAIISASDAPTVETETKMKRPNWTFPKLWTGGKAPGVDLSLETPKVDVIPTETKAEVQVPSGEILTEEPAEPDANLKKTTFLLPRFSFSKSKVKEPEISAELPCIDVSLPEGQVIVKHPEMQIKAPELEAELDGQGSKFKFPKLGIALPRAKGPGDLNASQGDAGIPLPEVKAEVKLPQIKVKEPPASADIKASETQDKTKDVGGSPLKFKMPTLKMPKFGAAPYDVTVEASDAEEVAERGGAKLQQKVNIKGLSVGMKTEESPAALTDSETPNTDTEAVVLGSPSKFKLPLFKMPKPSFSRPNPEEEHVPVHTERKEAQQEVRVEPKEESKSPKGTFTSFGELLESVDVEFKVPKTPEHRDTSKEGHETDGSGGKELEARAKETKQEAVRSPERTGWFKFPTFGLSSPSEPAEDATVGKSPVEETSSSCSVQSSDAFADISSAMTSELGGASLASPTKVTVRYSGPDAATGPGELLRNICTTRTELISVKSHLPEKVTILSSGASSSSEDTLRLDSGRIHVVTSNIQATPEARRAELLTAVQIQSAGGLSRGPGAHGAAASWTAEDSRGNKTLFERRFVSQTSSEISESKETIVVTKQITRRFDSSEPVSGDAASSVRRLRDSVHSDKMRFFDGADE